MKWKQNTGKQPEYQLGNPELTSKYFHFMIEKKIDGKHLKKYNVRKSFKKKGRIKYSPPPPHGLEAVLKEEILGVRKQ